MKRTLNLLLLFLILAVPSFAGKVSKTEAQQIAQKFMTRQMHRSAKARFAAIPAKLRLSKSTDKEFAPFYVYNADNSQGFVIVSGDDAIGQIIGYSDTGSFEMENAPSNIVTMLQMFARLVENAPANAARRAPHIPDANPTKGNVVISPLLDEEGIQWGQDAPFNGMMPTYTAEAKTKHYFVGCVATAMAQIMRYHRWPAQGIGELTYTSNIGQDLTANFGTTTYDWNNMPGWLEKDNTNAEQNKQVATLSYQAAVSVHMSFAPAGSGAFSQAVTGALVNYFGYDKAIAYKKREYFSTKEWMDMIKAELNAKRPVFYSASNEDGQGGHAYVCDGYDDQDYVHINWGWYGKSNGYFLVNALNPYDLGIGANGGGYNLQQEIITGIQKPVEGSKRSWDIYCDTRFTATLLSTGIQCMSIISNHDCDDFDGVIAAVLINKDGKIVANLKEQPLTVKGVNLDKKPLTNGDWAKMQDCSVNVPGVADGNDYKIIYAVKAKGTEDWNIVLAPNSLPNYAIATVKDGKIIAVDQHKPIPDVTLLDKITPDGTLYAGGSGCFKVHIRNNSTDYYVTRVWLKFTSIDDPSKVYYLHEADEKLNNVYDSSEKELSLLINLPADMPEGKYKVIAFDKAKPKAPAGADFEQYPFKEDLVGETILEVKKAAQIPVIRQLGNFAWLSSGANENEIVQGDKVLFTHPVRNYGLEGTVNLLLKVQNVENEEETRDFIRLDAETFKQQERKDPMYYVRTDLNPGKYKLLPYFVYKDTEYPMEGTFEDCIIEVKANNALPLTATAFEVPSIEWKQGTNVKNIKFTLKASEATKGMFYIRFRPASYRAGTLAYMKAVSLAAGESKDFVFNYKPSTTLANGAYLLYMEYRPQGKKSGEEITVRGENTKVIYLGITAGIDDVNTTGASAADFTIDGRNIYFGDIKNIRNIAVYSISGAKVFSTSAVSSTVSLPLANGIYVLRVATVDGTVTKKIVLK